MKIARIDDRLIHGQVIVGWVKKLGLSSLILLHRNLEEDIVALYSSMLEEEVAFSSINLGREIIIQKTHSIYIASSVQDFYDFRYDLKKIGFDLLNFGGMRTKESKTRILDFIYMNKHEMAMALELSEELGCKTNAQELPESEEFNIIKIIKEHL